MGDSNEEEKFPWHLGVFDAHCHPTDIMSSIPAIPEMKARCLTVMGTRAQDQHLVAQVAEQYGVRSGNPAEWKREECMVPCFGWHPWFAHMMYFDAEEEGSPNSSTEGKERGEGEGEAPPLTGSAKISHYANVLAPQRDAPSPSDTQTYLSFPDPTPFSAFLAKTRENLQKHPFALVGEIGLDRSFRIPEAYSEDREDNALTPGGREGRRLTPFRCTPAHQKRIFKAQLQLAAALGRAVSVHGVQAHGLVFDTIKELWVDSQLHVPSKREKKKRGADDATVRAGLDGRTDADDNEQQEGSESKPKSKSKSKPYPPRICLHSYSGSASTFSQYLSPKIPVAFFASFSSAVNLGDDLEGPTPEAFVQLVKTVPDDMVLVESDLHTAGAEMDRRLEDMVRRICEIKGWGLEEGVGTLGRNWRRFVFGEG